MDSKAIAGKIAKQDWLEPLADTVQSAIATAFESAGDSGKQIKDMLHGTWLGHPLHPVLTDVPIGAWTTAVALDMLDSVRKDDTLRAGAEAAIGLGIVGAIGAAITGLADWHVLGEDEPKRVGMAHSLVNTAATVLFATSLALRKKKSYTAGKFTALAGLATLTAGAYLGGVLVYEDELGVDHSPQESAADQWTSVINESELREGKPKRVELKDIPLVLVRKDGEIYALAEKCSHLGGPLSEGKIEGMNIQCPWHRSEFDLATGAVRHGPATFKQPCYETRIRDGKIQVRKLSTAATNGKPARAR